MLPQRENGANPFAEIPLGQLTPGDFRRLAELVEGYSGIRMPDSKRTMVEGRLRKRVRELGLRDLSAYCAFVFDEGGLDREFTHLIDAVTTNKTDFFREPQHFQFLQRTAIPAILAEGKHAGARTIKLWSSASSTGAEAYTLAMVLASMNLGGARFAFRILGTDICTEVLEDAMQAVYPEEMIDPVPMDMRQRFLLRHTNPEKKVVRIIPELRHHVHFAYLNLMDEHYAVDRDMDIIFCRNVLIYFDRPTQKLVLSRLCRHLRPGGYLFLGHSESMAGSNLPLTQVAPTIFRYDTGFIP